MTFVPPPRDWSGVRSAGCADLNSSGLSPLRSEPLPSGPPPCCQTKLKPFSPASSSRRRPVGVRRRRARMSFRNPAAERYDEHQTQRPEDVFQIPAAEERLGVLVLHAEAGEQAGQRAIADQHLA